MTHQLAVLLHFLAANQHGPTFVMNHPTLCESMPRAIELGLVQHPENCNRVAMDQFWLELTDKGRSVIDESLCAMSEFA